MLKVDSKLLQQLQTGETPEQTFKPPRRWSEDKFQNFLNKLKKQTKHEAPVPSS